MMYFEIFRDTLFVTVKSILCRVKMGFFDGKR
jgi:hypothetical protein